MNKPGRCEYTPYDFQDWQAGGTLAIQPKFQRREVWSTQKKSYLIDTLLKRMPVPPIFLRVAQSKEKNKVVREVVDGQQRISAVLGFIDGKFSLSKPQAAEHGAARFEKLSAEKQNLIREFPFVCEVFHGISDVEVLEIFARVNTYSIPLNRQELLNGKYFGFFKRSAYKLGYEHLEFWRQNGIFSETAIARMSEAELTSELLIILLSGMQHKKDTIENFYRDYDAEFPNQSKIESRFRSVIDAIQKILESELIDTEFHRSPFFYSLFAVVSHRLFGIPGQTTGRSKTALTSAEIQTARDALLKLSELITQGKEAKGNGDVSSKFLDACLKSTDKLPQRQIRFDTIYERAFGK
jgi:nucleoside diphosphate kinase